MRVEILDQDRVILASDGSKIEDDAFLPWKDSTVDFLHFPDTLSHVRMDQLYMLLGEARRVVRAGGLLRISGPAPERRSWRRLLAWILPRGPRVVLPEHYLSPEHWEEAARTETLHGPRLTVDYRRTAFPSY